MSSPSPIGAAETRAAKTLAHSLQQLFLLLRSEVLLNFQQKTSHFLLQGILEVIYGGYLGRNFGFIGLRLVDKFIEPLTLLVQLLAQFSYLLPVGREPLL